MLFSFRQFFMAWVFALWRWLAVAAHRSVTQWSEDGLRLQCVAAAKTMT
jgi:hypothetical protein